MTIKITIDKRSMPANEAAVRALLCLQPGDQLSAATESDYFSGDVTAVTASIQGMDAEWIVNGQMERTAPRSLKEKPSNSLSSVTLKIDGRPVYLTDKDRAEVAMRTARDDRFIYEGTPYRVTARRVDASLFDDGLAVFEWTLEMTRI